MDANKINEADKTSSKNKASELPLDRLIANKAAPHVFFVFGLLIHKIFCILCKKIRDISTRGVYFGLLVVQTQKYQMMIDL